MQGPRHILTRQLPHEHKLNVLDSLRARRANNTVKHPDPRILGVITGLAAHYGKSHCQPTQATLLRLVEKFTGRTMSRRTLNRHLRTLENEQYIRRIRRHRRDPKRGFVMRSTCYVPMWRTCRRLARDAATISQILTNQLSVATDSIRVTKMAQYLNRFFKSVITASQKKAGGTS